MIFYVDIDDSLKKILLNEESCDMYTVNDQGIMKLNVYKPYHVLICILPHIGNRNKDAGTLQERRGTFSSIINEDKLIC